MGPIMRRATLFLNWTRLQDAFKLPPRAWWLVNSLTFGTLVVSLSAAITNQPLLPWLMLALIMDGLDGPLARAWKVTSSFGRKLDLVVDLIAFVLIPTMIAYKTEELAESGFLIVMTCAAWRFCRLWNARPDHQNLSGLAFPMAGLHLYSGILLGVPWLASIVAAAGMFTNRSYPKVNRLSAPAWIGMSCAGLSTWCLMNQVESLIYGITLGYALSTLIPRQNRVRPTLSEPSPRPESHCPQR